MKKIKLFVPAVLICCLFSVFIEVSFGQEETDKKAAASSNTVLLEPDDSYLISPGDVLEIRVFNRPQFSRESVRVNEEGRIRLPFVENDIRVTCLTERELSDKLTEIYKEYIRTPQVDVMIREYQSQPVAVLGSVRNPSRLQLLRRRQIRLLELLAFVGGPSEKAGRSIQVIRTGKGFQCQAKEMISSSAPEEDPASAASFYKLKDTLAGDTSSNPYIQPGDIVILPEADQAFIVGNVLKPSTLSLQEPITISQAIAMSGGVLPDTNRDKVRILRQQPGSPAKKELIVDLKAIEKQQAEDILLQPNDIVDIPVSGKKRLLKSFIGAIVPSIGQLPIKIIP